MFIDKVKVSGYQSLYDVELELGQFTVIYGASDVGKSAFYRAFRSLVTCESGDSFISKGMKKTQIEIHMSSGEVVHFVKREGKSGEYSLVNEDNPNGKIWKRNRHLPSELAELLLFGAVVVEGEKAYPNFRGQFDPMFLMFESSGKKARMLGSLISNVLLQGIRKANVERNRNQADVRALLELIEELENKKEFDWDSFLLKVGVEKEIIERLKLADKLYNDIKTLIREREELESLSDFDVEFIDPKELSDLLRLVTLLEDIQSLCREREREKSCYDKAESERKNWVTEMSLVEFNIDDFKSKMMFKCPSCGHSISRLEIEDGKSE